MKRSSSGPATSPKKWSAIRISGEPITSPLRNTIIEIGCASMIFAFCLTLLFIQNPDASPARLMEYPLFIAMDPQGNVVVGDQDAPAVLRATPDGAVRTLFKASKRFRTPLNRPRGIAVDHGGDVYACDPTTMDVYRISADGKPVGLTGKEIKELDGRPGVRGEIIQPEGIAVAADGTVYVADLRLHTIYKLTKGSKTPTKVATVEAPHGMTLDPDGSLVVVSHGESHLVRVRPSDGSVTKILPGRLQGNAPPFPLSVARRADGGYLVTDNYNRCLWAVSPDGKASVFTQLPEFKKVTGVAVAKDGKIAVADPGNGCIHWLSSDGQIIGRSPKG
jgi:DNA-binding beta-propeller fold protein YncE